MTHNRERGETLKKIARQRSVLKEFEYQRETSDDKEGTQRRYRARSSIRDPTFSHDDVLSLSRLSRSHAVSPIYDSHTDTLPSPCNLRRIIFSLLFPIAFLLGEEDTSYTSSVVISPIRERESRRDDDDVLWSWLLFCSFLVGERENERMGNGKRKSPPVKESNKMFEKAGKEEKISKVRWAHFTNFGGNLAEGRRETRNIPPKGSLSSHSTDCTFKSVQSLLLWE